MSAYKYFEDIKHPTPNGLDKTTKISNFVDRIRPHANLEMILSAAYNNESLENDFSLFVNLIESEVIRTKE